MGIGRFLIILVVIGISSLTMVYLLNTFAQLPLFTLEISVASIILFSLFCVLIYFIAVNYAASRNLYKFNNVIVISILGKLALSMAFLGSFRKIYMPESKYVYVPFLIFYLVYTIFETYFLSIIGKQKKI